MKNFKVSLIRVLQPQSLIFTFLLLLGLCINTNTIQAQVITSGCPGISLDAPDDNGGFDITDDGCDITSLDVNPGGGGDIDVLVGSLVDNDDPLQGVNVSITYNGVTVSTLVLTTTAEGAVTIFTSDCGNRYSVSYLLEWEPLAPPFVGLSRGFVRACTEARLLAGQCTLSCEGEVQVSLDTDCRAEITTIMMLSDDGASCDDDIDDPAWQVIISNAYGVIPTSPYVTGANIGEELTATIISPSGNSCWGYLTVEDKLGPNVVDCPGPIVEISCAQFGLFELPTFEDACEGPVPAILRSETIVDATCEAYVKEVTRTYYAVDSKGRASQDCTVTYRLLRMDVFAVSCPYNYLVGENTHLNCDGTWNTSQCHQEGFEGILDPALWSVVVSGPGGGTAASATIDVTGAPDLVEITGYDLPDGINNQNTDVDLCIDMTCGATLSFTWAAHNDGRLNRDEPAYVLNGSEVILIDMAEALLEDADGMVNLDVNPGDQFCFRVKSMNRANETTLTISEIKLWGLNGLIFDTDTNGDGVNDAESNNLWDEDGDGYPDVNEVSVPTMNGVPIYPTPDFFCNVGVFYSDVELPQVGCTKKIMRVWSIREWHCGTEYEMPCTQIIEIYDNTAPVVEACENIVISTNATIQPTTTVEYGVTSCGAEIMIPLPNATDNCQGLHYDITYPGGFVKDYTGETYVEIPMGTNEVTFTVYDECYNSSQCTFIVEVVDNQPPVTICDQYTVVSLTNNGIAHAYAEVFDDGSYDDCKMHCMLVQRMDDHNCPCEIPQFCDLDYVGEHEGHHYYLSNYEKSRTIAKARAHAYGGSLAIFDSEDEEDWAVDAIREKYNGNFWIGADRVYGGFTWCDGTSLSYDNWEIDRPFNGGAIELDFTANPSMGNTILVADGAEVDDDDDMVYDLIVSPGTSNGYVDINWNWIAPTTGNCTEDYGIDMKLLYHNGTSWTTVQEYHYTGDNSTNTIAPFLDIEQSAEVTNFKIAENANCGTHYFRIAIEDNCDEDDEVAGNFATDTDGNHFDNADVAFEVSMSAACSGDCVYVNANNKWEDGVCAAKARYLLEIDDICGFSSFAQFCCDDTEGDKMVLFRAIDAYGNYNDCMVTVEVQDKIIPSIVCPKDVTINCTEVVDLLNMAPQFGEATVSHGCEATMVEKVIRELGQCNTGRIIRSFIASNGSGVVDSCHQYITIENTNRFDEYDIVWPDLDTIVYGCLDPANYGPDVMGYPELFGNECDLVGANYDDQVFYFTQGSDGVTCSKILRTWSVIDWCQYTENPVTGERYYATWPAVQVIKLANQVEPETMRCDDVWICNYDDECGPIEVTLTADALDDCTEELSWIANIDLWSDGDFDQQIEGWGPVEEGTNVNLASVTGTFENGHHTVLWQFYDNCGNLSTCSYDFIISSCKAATPYCINGLAVDLMPIDTTGDGIYDLGMVQLWAKDFDAGSSHPCTDEVFLSFSEDINDTFMDFDCDDLGDQVVTIYTSVAGAHEGEYIQAYCETYVNVQDNNNACGGGSGPIGGKISGNVRTEMQDALGKVEVKLIGNDGDPEMTNDQGGYAFGEMPFGGNYVIEPTRNDHHLNGVSTLDLVLIQRHILGLESLDSPFKIIAGDINKDTELSSIDLIELRKLILGIYSEYPENTSWRFVNADYNFVDMAQPLYEDFEEVYDINDMNSDMVVDFVGMKVGDVNYSAELELRNENIVDSRSNLNLEVREQLDFADHQLAIPVYAQSDNVLYGMQFTIQVDQNLSFNSILPNQIDMDEKNIGTGIKDQMISISWNNPNSVEINDDEPLFTIVLDKISDTQVFEPINLNSSITKAEMYTDLNTIETPQLIYRDLNGNENRFELYQNMPNPFSSTTEIKFILPSATQATLTITDITGKVIKVVNGQFVKGMNSIVLSSEDFDVSGFLYYTLKTTEHKATRKMVLVN